MFEIDTFNFYKERDMRFMKILILMLSVIFVTNCSDGTASDPQTDFFIEKFVEDGNSEKDAKCLAFAMKKSMPEDLWNNYYDLIVMQESEEDMDMEELGALMEFAFAALPHVMAASEECGVELDM